MDHAVSLVEAYLQLNGYFTSVEYPVVAYSESSGRYRTITDIDVLAYRFPATARVIAEGSPLAPGGEAEADPGLGIPEDRVDMIIGEVKEGRVNFNLSATDPAVLETVLARLGIDVAETPRVIEGLREKGSVTIHNGFQVRMVAFGAMPHHLSRPRSAVSAAVRSRELEDAPSLSVQGPRARLSHDPGESAKRRGRPARQGWRRSRARTGRSPDADGTGTKEIRSR